VAYYKTEIRVEVLTDGPFEWDTLENVAYAITHGSASGLVYEWDYYRLTEEELVEECDKHGTDPTYFLDFAAETGEFVANL